MANQKQLIFFMHGGDGHPELVKESSLKFLTFPHPKGTPIAFMDLSGEIMELQTIQPYKHMSWFINQKVSSNQNITLVSKVDPRFLLLPSLEKAGSKFSPLDRIIVSNDIEGCDRIPLQNFSSWKLEEICDVKDLGDDLILFKFNEEKTVKWLTEKVQRTAKILMSQRLAKRNNEFSAFSGVFISGAQSKKDATGAVAGNGAGSELSSSAAVDLKPEQEDIKQAAQIVADYLTDNMTLKLVTALGLSTSDMTAKQQNNKRKADWEAELEIEKETVGVMSIPKPADKPASQSTAAPSTNITAAAKKKTDTKAAAAKPVPGVKSITSFFGKK